MWKFILERIPTLSEWFYILFAFVVPYAVYKINQLMHKELDPPWKKEEKKNKVDQKQPSN